MVTPERFSLVQFGHGRFRSVFRRQYLETRHIAVEIASDENERYCRALGLPVPAQSLVRSERGAVRAAEKIGYPVVVKPYNANHGRGVSLNETSSQVREAVAKAQGMDEASSLSRCDWIRSSCLSSMGSWSRLLSAYPTCDWRWSLHIKALVDRVNEDPRRGSVTKVLTRLELDYQAERLMNAAGYTAEQCSQKTRSSISARPVTSRRAAPPST